MQPDIKCVHGRSIYVRCEDCAWMMTMPDDDGWYRVIALSPDGICTRDFPAGKDCDL